MGVFGTVRGGVAGDAVRCDAAEREDPVARRAGLDAGRKLCGICCAGPVDEAGAGVTAAGLAARLREGGMKLGGAASTLGEEGRWRLADGMKLGGTPGIPVSPCSSAICPSSVSVSSRFYTVGGLSREPVSNPLQERHIIVPFLRGGVIRS